MKKYLFSLFLLFAAVTGNAQNVGIGTSTPLQKLHVQGATFLNGNVGIGENTPAFPLSFGPALGDKISLWSNSTNSYGFGIQSGLLQIHTDVSAADIAFGYGSSTAFTEKMRIKGDGNVGIGITTPTASLEVMRGTGTGGTAVFRGTTNISHFNFGTDEDTYIRAGKDNRNVIINDIPGGKVGIGTGTPNAPLGFPATVGKKITLYPGGTGDIGLAVQGNLLQMYADHPNADIAFGYDQGGIFTERMRIKGNGNIGLGVNDPTLKLDISGRMRIRTGTDGEAGIWLNNYANTALQAFIGLENDNYVGFYGSGAGWKFGMNTQTGALKINGTEGTAGQVLQSNGNGSTASWASSTNSLYNKTNIFYGNNSGSQPFPAGNSPVLITGLTYTFSVAGNARVLVSFTVPILTTFCASCPPANVRIYMRLNSNFVGTYKDYIGSMSDIQISASNLLQVGAGNHTIEIFAAAVAGGPGFFIFGNSSVDTNSMIVQVIPE